VLPGVTHKDSDLIPGIMRQLWVFLAYVAAARLAILLALPPGYASPIWPAAGLAMAATIVWGPSLTLAIFLGSIATNLRPDELMQNPMDQILMQICLALGSSIQAYLGSLVYHVLDRRSPHSFSPQRLSLEVLLVGPIACMTAATIAVTALTAFQIIEVRMFMNNWISWWLGDSFGAGVLCPLLVRLHQNFQPRQIRMKVAPYLLAPAGLCLILVAALVIHLNNNDRRNQKSLEHTVTDFHRQVQQDIARILQNVQSLAEYSRALEPLVVMERYQKTEKDGTQLLWAPRVLMENRPDFEQYLGKAQQHFTILEKASTGHLAPAASRQVYWPIISKTDQDLNLLPSGFDLGSLPGVADLMQKAWEDSASLSSHLLTLEHNKKALLLIQKGLNQQGSAFHQGFFLALIPLDNLLKPALAHLNHPIFHVQIQAQGQTPAEAYSRWFGIAAQESQNLRFYGGYHKPLMVGSHTMTLQVDFSASAYHGGRMGDPMFVTMLCMILAFLLNILIVSQQNMPMMVNPKASPQQDEFLVQYEALRDADRNKAQLLAHVSQQIRSPLQGILGLLDMLRGNMLDTKQRSSIDTIIANCHSMHLMLDDVHTYASLETGHLVLAKDEFLLEECVFDLTKVYEIAAEEQNNEFKSQIELPRLLRVRGDRHRLHRILSHLMSDAISRTQNGRIILKVSLRPDQSLLFSIESQRSPQDYVHDNEWEFGNVKTWQPLEAFNLKTCEHLAQAMGGRLTLERPDPLVSRMTLTLTLPVTLPRDTALPHTDAQYQEILVVDDNAINLTVASGLLTKLGYDVETAANGQEAVLKVKQKRYDVIFMDCQMPGMDGYETTRHIRAFHGPERGPLIIALTANDLEDIRDRALQAGMDTLLMKPISLEALIQTVGYAKKKTPMPTPQLTSIMDFKAFSRGLGDDSELIRTAVLRYLEEINGIMTRLRSEVERGDAAALAKTAHTLKGMTSLFAAHALVEANRNLELAGKEGRVQEFAGLLKMVENLTELLKMELRKLIDGNPTRKDVA
jgi:CheY-like chemotaxis protein/integral membrane sensor domain MASE1/HPt (histidine-containing phosphotransfer) domain-containing protein